MQIFYFILPFLQVDVQEKLKNAPDGSHYETGIIIGSFIPFALLAIIILYLFYRANKKGNNSNKL